MPHPLKPLYDIKETVNENDFQTLPSRGSQWEPDDISAKSIIRRIDRKILPLLCAVYFLQFMDKIVLNYANVMGLQEDIGMTGNDFSWAGTAFFLGYLVADFPQGALLQRFPVTRVLSINVCLWGIVTASTAAAQNSRELLALRTLLGVFEAAVTPSLIMITSAWYKRDEGAARFGIWFCGLGVGQLLGGLMSFGFQHFKMDFQGWRLMFLVVGVTNVVVSFLVYSVPSAPSDASWLNSTEKSLILRRLKEDHAGTGAKILRTRSVLEALLDLQTWLLCGVTLLTCMSSGVVVYFSASIIKGFGYSAQEAALLNMPSGIVSIVTTISAVYFARRNQRCYAMIAVSVVSTLGACLMSFLPFNNKTGLLIGTYLISAAPTALSLVSSVAACNLRGYTRKIVGGAMIALSFSAANLISPQTFRTQDAPNYWPAKIILVAVMAASVIFAAGLRWLYAARNARADECNEPAMSRYERSSVKHSSASLDFADREFRYSY